MPELWTPGMIGPLEELVKRILRRIDTFAAEHKVERVSVSVELADGALHRLASLSPEPGFGFITLCPHCEERQPEELIVPLGAIREIRIGVDGGEQQLGFSLPAEPARPQADSASRSSETR
jgi:hypothetical protein